MTDNKLIIPSTIAQGTEHSSGYRGPCLNQGYPSGIIVRNIAMGDISPLVYPASYNPNNVPYFSAISGWHNTPVWAPVPRVTITNHCYKELRTYLTCSVEQPQLIVMDPLCLGLFVINHAAALQISASTCLWLVTVLRQMSITTVKHNLTVFINL